MAPLPGWQPLTTDICAEKTLASGTKIPDCHFGDLITLFKNGMTDLVIISTLLVVVALVFAGFKLVTAGMRGDSGALKDTKSMFGNIALGYGIVLTAWLLVYTITSVLLKSEFTLIK